MTNGQKAYDKFTEDINQAAKDAYEREMDEINEQLEKEILFAMIGDVNTGKSSTINHIIGEEVAPIGAKPGETTKIKKYNYKNKIIFVDTPGLDDINSNNSEATWDFYKEADIILFFLNAAGTVFSEGEKTIFEQLKKVNNNIIIVLNKIDAADDIPSLVKYVQDHTNYDYQVTPISSKTGENINILQKAIVKILEEKKKDILFVKNIKEKSSVANKWILTAAASATAIGASPIPGSDILPLTGIQAGLLVKLATLYEKPLTKDRAVEIILSSIAGNIGKNVFRQIIKMIPGAGSVVGASVAGGMTLALGYAIKYAYENDIELDAAQLSILYNIFQQKEKTSC